MTVRNDGLASGGVVPKLDAPIISEGGCHGLMLPARNDGSGAQ